MAVLENPSHCSCNIDWLGRQLIICCWCRPGNAGKPRLQRMQQRRGRSAQPRRRRSVRPSAHSGRSSRGRQIWTRRCLAAQPPVCCIGKGRSSSSRHRPQPAQLCAAMSKVTLRPPALPPSSRGRAWGQPRRTRSSGGSELRRWRSSLSGAIQGVGGLSTRGSSGLSARMPASTQMPEQGIVARRDAGCGRTQGLQGCALDLVNACD